MSDFPQFEKRNLKCQLSVRVTPKMKKALEAVGNGHGVGPAFMLRTILMQFLDFPSRTLDVSGWRDRVREEGFQEVIIVRVTKEMNQRMESACDSMGINNTQLCRVAAVNYLSRHPLTKPQPDVALRGTKTAL